jgi:hypothetical protein
LPAADGGVLPRLAADAAAAALAAMPVVVVMGARQTGKSTLVRTHPAFRDRPAEPESHRCLLVRVSRRYGSSYTVTGTPSRQRRSRRIGSIRRQSPPESRGMCTEASSRSASPASCPSARSSAS